MAKHLNEYFQTFCAGPDLGIDALSSKEISAPNIIVQCKHYSSSRFDKFLKLLRDHELPKVLKANPKRYILATSQSLNPQRKEKIMQTFSGFIICTDDIFGVDDIQSLLRSFPGIAKQHYKLWLSSISALELFMNVKVIGRSRLKAQVITEKIRLYNDNSVAKKVRAQLKKESVVVLSGPPGVGKTTIAEITAFHYINIGFVFRNVCSIEELEEVVYSQEDQKVLILFDDFIGSNTVDLIQNREESKLYLAIQCIARSKDKKLLMTTRLSIEKQAFLISEKITKAIKGLYHVYMRYDSYNIEDRAFILFNHIDLRITKKEFRDYIKDNGRYMLLLSDATNPRSIDHITLPSSYNGKDPRQYFSFARKTLQKPMFFWENSIKKGLSGNEKKLLKSIFYFGGSVKEDTLYDFLGDMSIEDIEDMLSVLNESFIKREMYSGEDIYLSFINPSIGDYFLSSSEKTSRSRIELIKSLGETGNIGLLISCHNIFKSAREINMAWDLVKNPRFNIPMNSRIVYASKVSDYIDCEDVVLQWFKDTFAQRKGVVLHFARHIRPSVKKWQKLSRFLDSKKDIIFRDYVLNNIELSKIDSFCSLLSCLDIEFDKYLDSLADKEEVLSDFEYYLEEEFEEIKSTYDFHGRLSEDALDELCNELEDYSMNFDVIFDGILSISFDTDVNASDFPDVLDDDDDDDDDDESNEEGEDGQRSFSIKELFDSL